MSSSLSSFRTICLVVAVISLTSACIDREPPKIDDEAQRHHIEEQFASIEKEATGQLDDVTDALEAAHDRVDEAARESSPTVDIQQ